MAGSKQKTLGPAVCDPSMSRGETRSPVLQDMVCDAARRTKVAMGEAVHGCCVMPFGWQASTWLVAHVPARITPLESGIALCLENPMRLSRRPRAALLAGALSTALGGLYFAPEVVQAKPAKAASVDIPYEEFTLPNGLRVIVHTDRKAPIVAVNLWYHVGSKDEPAGRSGFAHLFEHLMFNGS